MLCCAVGARNICVRFADVTCNRRESGAYVTQMLRAKFAYDVRHVARASSKCYAHPPREERATRDVYFWTPLYCSARM
jgi:hypothetical protein